MASDSLPTNQTLLELHVASADVDRFAPLLERLKAAGITFTRLRELQQEGAQWLERFTDLDNETRSATGDAQVPRSVGAMRARLADLMLDPDACFVARHHEHWVAYTVLDTAHSSVDRLRQSWTGVLPAYRRRGIATALKVLTVEYARRHGYSTIATATRSGNLASQAMNRRVGFRPAAR
jgi:GNAT superfamily N-acetyltransferase